MVTNKDYYAILGVPRNASIEDVKKAYRRLARKFHPDLHPGDKEMEAKFKDINEAYSVLINPEKRKQYDLGERVVFEGAPFTGGPFGGFRGVDFRDFGADLGGVEEIFGEIFGGRGAYRLHACSKRHGREDKCKEGCGNGKADNKDTPGC
jgi:molecular chaperone DnaJ